MTVGTDGERHRSRFHHWFRSLPVLLALAALVRPLATCLARVEWRADVLTHFQEPALAIALLAAFVQPRRRRLMAMALLVLAVAQAIPLCRFWGPNPVKADRNSRNRLRILVANVLADNNDYGRLEQLIRRERPDIVGLIEVTDEWIAGLADVRAEFPHRVEYPNGPLGLSLWYREAPRSLGTVEVLTPGGNPLLHATLSLGGRDRQLWLVHPPNPIGRRGRGRSIPELLTLAKRIGGVEGSKLVLGDLNRTSGSPLFSDFLRMTNLRDSRLGFGRQPTWPAWSPYRIAIDHAFLSPDLAVVDRRIGPSIGSDHFPLILDVAPASARKSAIQASQSTP